MNAILKITEAKYIHTYQNCQLFFSCCADYVTNEKKGVNDKREAIFAQYPRDDYKKMADKYYHKLGKDLDLIDDPNSDFIQFRRKSALFIPVSCFYTVDLDDLKRAIIDANADYEISSPPYNKTEEQIITLSNVKYTLPIKYKGEFYDKLKNVCILILWGNLKNHLQRNVLYNKVHYVDYNKPFDIFEDEIYKKIFPKMQNTDDALKSYAELFCKSDEFEHQNEFRLSLLDQRFKNKRGKKYIKINNVKSCTICENTRGKICDEYAFICNVGNEIRFTVEGHCE